MGEGGFRPESARQETPRVPEVAEKVEKATAPELIVDISELDLHESQSSFAIGRGFESFDEMPPIERAEFWAIESGVGDNYSEAEKAAKEAGLDREGQLKYKIRALEARMKALSRSSDKGHIREIHSLDDIGEALKKELKDLK